MKMAGLDAIRRKTADESARKSVLNFIPVVERPGKTSKKSLSDLSLDKCEKRPFSVPQVGTSMAMVATFHYPHWHS